jgi:hypothetical protein
MAKTLQEVKDALAAYEAAVADREGKQSQHEADSETLAGAITAENNSRGLWIAALQEEHRLEDVLEAAIVEHEPPAVG